MRTGSNTVVVLKVWWRREGRSRTQHFVPQLTCPPFSKFLRREIIGWATETSIVKRRMSSGLSDIWGGGGGKVEVDTSGAREKAEDLRVFPWRVCCSRSSFSQLFSSDDTWTVVYLFRSVSKVWQQRRAKPIARGVYLHIYRLKVFFKCDASLLWSWRGRL